MNARITVSAGMTLSFTILHPRRNRMVARWMYEQLFLKTKGFTMTILPV